MQVIPTIKSLSYLFFLMSGKDVMTTKLFRIVKVVDVEDEFSHRIAFQMRKYNYQWLDAYPVNGQKDQYKITQHSYYRNEHGCLTSGDRKYSKKKIFPASEEKTYFTKKEVKNVMDAYEKNMMNHDDVKYLSDPPPYFSAFSIHKKSQKSLNRM